MSGKTMVMRIGLVWAVISLLAACAQTQRTVDPIGSEQYSAEISRLENLVRQNPGSSKGWQAHYELAQRYMSHDNPGRDYVKALAHLKLYASHDPNAADDQYLQNWLAVLEEIQTLSRDKRVAELNAKLTESKHENLALKKAISELENENAELDMKIEMLKTLDHAVEEKRKTYNTE
jgi:hypothetical protein